MHTAVIAAQCSRLRAVGMALTMTSYLKRVFRFFVVMALVPLVVGLVSAWSAGLGLLLFLLGLPAAAIALGVGSILWLFRAANLSLPNGSILRRMTAIMIVPLLLTAVVLASRPLLDTGRHAGTSLRLMVNQNHFENIIAGIQKEGTPVDGGEDGGVTYWTDLGPPVRIAFNPEGILDNWSGIIFDPTGDVLLADWLDPKTGKFVAPDQVTKLFGGDLVSCRHLWGDYYRCSFT
jgi:hypothetical protein